MIKPICKDIFFLGQKAVLATIKDIKVGYDLMDTLLAHKDECVGMAANMIAVNKNVIIVNMGMINCVMFNPCIIKKKGKYHTEEGCLSLIGIRPTKRYENIEVEYYDFNFKKHIEKFSGFTAQIIQHEIDHTNGILI